MIAIIGGGICGLSIGWYLAQEGQPVTVLERGQAGRAATWAAAGMLTPWSAPTEKDDSKFKLQLASHALWPNFARNLEAATDINLDYRTQGRLFIILDHEDARGLKEHYQVNKKRGLPVEWLSGDEARQREPHLSPAVTDAVFTPTGHLVDNRQVALALCRAFEQAGGTLRQQTEVRQIVVKNNRVQGVRLSNGEMLPAKTVVLAAGAWSQKIAGLPADTRPPVRPVKGQMLALQMPPNQPLIKHMVTGPIYLLPRTDGRLLIGATVEEKGFDTQVMAGAIFDMLGRARQMLPAIDELPIVETWAGLRPATPDESPILGPTGIQGLIAATGHYRHGILLAPITAQAICRLVLTGKIMPEIEPFLPQRFND